MRSELVAVVVGMGSLVMTRGEIMSVYSVVILSHPLSCRDTLLIRRLAYDFGALMIEGYSVCFQLHVL